MISHYSEVMQINDIIIGAIGYHKNGLHLLDGAAKGKVELADYIAKGAGLKDLVNDTPFKNFRFGIWNIQFNKQ